MRQDFDAIPEAAGEHERVGSMLTRIYHDIGLAAVADALDLMAGEFDSDMTRAIERGVYFLIPVAGRPARVGLAA